MSDVNAPNEARITNCHVHTFNRDHIPIFYPHVLLYPFKLLPPLIRLVAFLIRPFWPSGAETLDRLYRFQKETGARDQTEMLEKLRRHYPADTRFVVLPMAMEHIGRGRVRKPLRAQHEELREMMNTDKYRDILLPFATLHPDAGEQGAKDAVALIRDEGFRGLKIYPRLGFAPDHPLLMKEVYPVLEELGKPVMTHCSRGGVMGRGVSWDQANAYTDPQAYVGLMEKFPKLRVCLAHFGGGRDWKDYVENGMPPGDAQARKANWQVAIRDMIRSGKWPGLWTDISYTLFHFDDNVPFLKLFLEGSDDRAERLRSRVLFGSDFYMTRQERLSERAVCFRLRNALGEPLFRRLATENPAVWLGETTRDTWPGP